jgi:hypothetical protein
MIKKNLTDLFLEFFFKNGDQLLEKREKIAIVLTTIYE